MVNPEIKNTFKLTPAELDIALLVAHEAGQQMLERLEWVTMQPTDILVLGGGDFAGLLQERYLQASVHAVGSRYLMLEFSSRQDFVSQTISLPDQSVDLIFANLVLPWVSDLKKIFAEWRRLLRPQGLLVFTSLGPDTLRSSKVLPQLIDMHDLGDMLVQEKFADPVLDQEYLTLNYRDSRQYFRELELMGMLEGSNEILLPTAEGVIPAQFELVHGHAWRPTALMDQTADEEGIVRIPLSHLRRPR